MSMLYQNFFTPNLIKTKIYMLSLPEKIPSKRASKCNDLSPPLVPIHILVH